METQLSTARRKIAALETGYAKSQNLVTEYENALALVLDKLRPYAYQHTQAIIALHKHYKNLLEQERQTSLTLRIQHSEWQAGLSRAAEYARLALREHSNSTLPYIRKIAGLKTENRVLRSLCGWESASDSSDDEAEKERKKAKKRASRTANTNPENNGAVEAERPGPVDG